MHKHGKFHSLGKDVLAMQGKFQTMVSLFGMPYIVSKSEAEAECAELNRRGLVDAVMSEDIDTLLFGGLVLVRGWAGNVGAQKTSKKVVIYDTGADGDEAPVGPALDSAPSAKTTSSPSATLDIYSASLMASDASINLSRRSLILFALLNGSDYTPGIKQLGAMTAYELVKDDTSSLGPLLADKIVEPFLREPSKTMFTPAERDQIRTLLREHLVSNPSKFLSRKKPSAAANILPDFPSEAVILSYLRPKVHDTYPRSLLDHLDDPFLIPLDWTGLQNMASEEFGWGSHKLADKFDKVVAEAVAFWEVRKAADRTAKRGIELPLEGDAGLDAVSLSRKMARDVGDGQPAITGFYSQSKPRGIPSSKPVDGMTKPRNNGRDSDPLVNPVAEIISIRKSRSDASSSVDVETGRDAGYEAKLKVKLVSMRRKSTEEGHEGIADQHPFPESIEIRVPLALARGAAPDLVADFERGRATKTPAKRATASGIGDPPGTPRKKRPAVLLEPEGQGRLLDFGGLASGDRSTVATKKKTAGNSARGVSTAARPTLDLEENPFLDAEPDNSAAAPRKTVAKEGIEYKPLAWNEKWEQSMYFSSRK